MIRQFWSGTAVTTFLLAVALVSGLATPAAAAGPHDGVYFVVLSAPGVSSSNHMTVAQNGGTIVIVNLYDNGTWDYGVGIITGNTASGELHEPQFGTTFGTFAFVVNNGVLTGAEVIRGVSFIVYATRIF